jgi:HPt (histidine-containing phosphotransfer) domain-containing protein
MSSSTPAQVVDFSYIDELSGGKPDFIRQVLTIFMENTPPGLKQLEDLIRNTNKWDAISKQAHFLKSSVSVIKIDGMHERLQKIELMAKEKKGAAKAEITTLLDEIVSTFSKAEVIINEKLEAASLQ